MKTITTGPARRTLVALAAAALAATALAPAATAAGPVRNSSPHAATQAALDAQVALGAPGVLAQAWDAKKGTWNGTAGVADRDTGRGRGAEDRFRIASVSKVFTSVVLLQLEAEGRLDLEDTVEKWLPGVVRGQGNDGGRITVRQLLDHTSGLYNYTEDGEADGTGFHREIHQDYLKHRFESRTPAGLLSVGLGHKPYFAPGRGWHYSNTNYILAGLIVEKVTGNRYGDEIRRRIIEPLGLRGTTLPGNTTRMPDPHGRAYSRLYADDPGDRPTYDVTDQNASWLWAAGEIISTTGDLNRFYRALLDGPLLPDRQRRELLTPVATGDEIWPGYGLGLARKELSCGVPVWTHDGDIHGSKTMVMSTPDGSHTAAFNLNGDWAYDLEALAEAEFCGVLPKPAPAAEVTRRHARPGAQAPELTPAGRTSQFPRRIPLP